MNLAVLSIIFLASLVSQSPLIAGLKSEKSVVSESKSILDGTKLIMSLQSGDAVVRRPRASASPQEDTQAPIENAAPKIGGTSGEKRPKNGGNGNKKLNRSPDVNAPVGGRNKHHTDKKPLNTGDQPQHHQHTGKRQQLNNRQQHGSLKSNKQRQLLKSQQHQEHQGHQGGKRNNNHKPTMENGEHGNDGSKAQPSCRYTKSAWSECDPKTNTHSRTLTLRKGDSNCLPTRTTQKKCKKACRYEKGTWSECKNGEMTRIDKLKTSTETSTVSTTVASCNANRPVVRKCNPDGNGGKSPKSHRNGNGHGKAEKKERKNNERVSNRNIQLG